MNHAAISVRDLSKKYAVRRNGSRRLLDFLGLRVGRANRQSDEFWALQDVSFDIVRGSTVGIVGRNGAGKSTLLRLLAGTSTPTSGEIVVNGRSSALLELGTGFHPDLTGHENIFASGLYLGLDRAAMEALYEEIVAFAELGEFIHQPVRTYSTGMYMRLAFSVATCLQADVQVIDEVLGVGDAYFFNKCLQRFRKLQEEGRTTVLVSHDHGTILRLCSRCIWMDRGSVVGDGTPLEVIAAYNESVYREQDRHGTVGFSATGTDLTNTQAMRTTGAIEVKGVEFLEATGEPRQVFANGQSMIVRIHYRSSVSLGDVIIAVVVHRIDGVTACNAISSMDGVHLEVIQGEGAVDLTFDRLIFAPGQYTVAVGIYPSFDLSDSATPQHAALWHKPNAFWVSQPAGISVDLGVFRHPVRWGTANGRDISRAGD